jgi:hypothetical protein
MTPAAQLRVAMVAWVALEAIQPISPTAAMAVMAVTEGLASGSNPAILLLQIKE